MLRDLGEFAKAIAADWVSLMSGVVGLGLMFAEKSFPDAAYGFLGPASFIALVFACFRIWRKAFHEARPYSENTLRHAVNVVNNLPADGIEFLDTLATQHFAAAPQQGNVWGLRERGLVSHDPSTGNCYLLPPYDLIIPQVLKRRRPATLSI